MHADTVGRGNGQDWFWTILFDDPAHATQGAQLANLRVSIYQCPSVARWEDVGARRDYHGVIGGLGAMSERRGPDRQPKATTAYGRVFSNGLFRLGDSVELRRVTDGTSNTFAVGESVSAVKLGHGSGYNVAGEGGPGCWFHGGSTGTDVDDFSQHLTGRLLRNTFHPMNSHEVTPYNLDNQQTNDACFSSDHVGGAQFLYADGHAEFVSEDIDHERTFQFLSSYNDGEVIDTSNL